MHEASTPRQSHLARSLPRPVQVVLVAAMALGVLAVFALGEFAGKPEAKVAAPAANGTFKPSSEQWAGLRVATVARRVFRTEAVTDGKIAADDDLTTPVFSPYSGRVTRLFAKAGDTVAKGAPLLAVAASEIVQGQNDVLAAAAALQTARSQLTLAQGNETRQHGLYQGEAGALKDWQQSQADLESARNAYRAAETALGAARNRLRILGKSDQEIAAVEKSQKIEAEAIVQAPIAGTVIQRQIGLGQFIQSGASSPVFAIGDLKTVWLVANVPETMAPAVRVGEPVEIHVLAYPDRVFTAKLTYVGSAVDPATRRLPVRAEIANPDLRLKAEMFARFGIITGDDVTAPAVPESAVVYDRDAARVWVAGSDDSVAAREIQAGHVQDGWLEVLGGLQAGERIVTSGTLFIDRAASGD